MEGASSLPSNFAALFKAFEAGNVEKSSSLLRALAAKRSDVVRYVNKDGFSLVDIAFMNGSADLMRLVLPLGGTEGKKFNSSDQMVAKLNTLISESKGQVEKFGFITNASVYQPSSSISQLSDNQIKECKRQQCLWQKRLQTLSKMKQGLEQSSLPRPPGSIVVKSIPKHKVSLRIIPNAEEASLFTKYKIEWSRDKSFDQLGGERVSHVRSLEHVETTLDGIPDGYDGFIRAAFGNPKGFGEFTTVSLSQAAKSTDARPTSNLNPESDHLEKMEKIYGKAMDQFRQRMKSSKKKSALISSLFSNSSGASKLQKSLTPNKVYLACIMNVDDKIAVATDDVVPMILVSDTAPGNIMTEYIFLAKLTSWANLIEKLQSNFEKRPNGGSMFRTKLLQALSTMCQILDLSDDIGRIFVRPLRTTENAVIFPLTIKCSNQKPQALGSALKWQQISKVKWPEPMVKSDSPISEHISFSKVMSVPVESGLYLCYLKHSASIGEIRLQISVTHPFLLPFVKVRPSSLVSSEERATLKQIAGFPKLFDDQLFVKASTTHSSKVTINEEAKMMIWSHLRNHSRIASSFANDLLEALPQLYSSYNLSQDSRMALYEQVIELNDSVSVMVVTASYGIVNPDNKDDVSSTDSTIAWMNLPLFETVHLSLFQPKLSKLLYGSSLLLEANLHDANQDLRNGETKESKTTDNLVSELTQEKMDVNHIWKSLCWVRHVIEASRWKPSPITKEKTLPQIQLPYYYKILAAYQSGLKNGTAVQVQVTSDAKVEEIVDLVVRQLDLIALLNGDSSVSKKNSKDFKLIASAEKSENILPVDAKLIQVQKPWDKRRLFIKKQ